MTRFHDWATRLDRFLVANTETEFAYGSWDCCLMACDAILTMTGTDPATWFRGRYSNRAGALAAIREYTGKATIKAVAERITKEQGMQEVSVMMAQRGDLVLLKRGRDYSLAIAALNGTEAIGLAARGMWRVPVADAVKCWRV